MTTRIRRWGPLEVDAPAEILKKPISELDISPELYDRLNDHRSPEGARVFETLGDLASRPRTYYKVRVYWVNDVQIDELNAALSLFDLAIPD